MKKIVLILALTLIFVFAFSFAISADDTCAHELSETYTYENGLLNKGNYSAVCSKCDYSVSEEKEAIFVVKGLALREDEENKKITYGYNVNRSLIDEYERINSCKITSGYLVSTGFNYHEDKKTAKADNLSNISSLNVIVNCGNDALTSCDVVIAGSYTITSENDSTTTYFQEISSYGLNTYENEKYGDAKVGVSYNAISKSLNDELQWDNSGGISDANGALQSPGTHRARMSTLVTVKAGDTISVPENSGYKFIIYAYHLDGSFYGYVDSDIADTSSNTENWGKTFTFYEGMKTGDNSKTIDVNDLCIRLVFRKDDGGKNGAIDIEDIKPVVMFNITNSDFVTVNFENCDIEPMYFATGRELGNVPKPVKEGYQFAGWYAKDDVNFTTPYTKETIINESVTLVPLFIQFPKENLTWADNTQINDGSGAIEKSSTTNARVTITDFIKVQKGDTISISRDAGYRFIVYFYTSQDGAYVNNSVVDINEEEPDSYGKDENWGYSYTFGDTITGYKGSPTVDVEDIYVRIVFRKDDDAGNGAINAVDIKEHVIFDIGANNSHLVPAEPEPEVVPSQILLSDNLVISHRGESNTAPENTIPAFEQAIANGVMVHEADVRFTKDGVPVLLHDSTVDRTSNGSGSVSNLTLEVLKTYDFGSWKGEKYTGTQILTLEEFVVYCKEKGMCIELDLANRGFTLEQKKVIYNVIKSNDMLGSTIFTATSSELADYISINKNIIVSVSGITSDSAATVLSNYSTCALVFASVPYANFSASLATTIDSYGENMRVKVWTASTQNEANYCFTNGADAVLVDNTLIVAPSNEE